MENSVSEPRGTFGTVPIPDPTKLTTEALEKSIAALRELQETKIDALQAKLETRMAEQEKAVYLLREFIKESIGALKDLHNEKFLSIATQFEERDVRTERTLRDAKTAIEAALQAAEKATSARSSEIVATVAETKGNFSKFIDAINDRITTLDRTIDDKLTILRDTINNLSGAQIGTRTGISAKEDSSKAMWVILGVVGGVAASLVPVLMVLFAKPGGP